MSKLTTRQKNQRIAAVLLFLIGTNAVTMISAEFDLQEFVLQISLLYLVILIPGCFFGALYLLIESSPLPERKNQNQQKDD